MLRLARPRGAAPNAIAAPTRAAATSRGILVRLATEVAAAGTIAPPAAIETVPPGAATMAAERPAPKGPAAAAAASASRVFLLRLPSGRPCFRGTGGVAASPLAPSWLPSGRPRSCPPGSSPAPAPVPLVAPSDDVEIEAGVAEVIVWWGEGMEVLGSKENPRELQDLRAGRARKAEPV
jgi:hypothetical protein